MQMDNIPPARLLNCVGRTDSSAVTYLLESEGQKEPRFDFLRVWDSIFSLALLLVGGLWILILAYGFFDVPLQWGTNPFYAMTFLLQQAWPCLSWQMGIL